MRSRAMESGSGPGTLTGTSWGQVALYPDDHTRTAAVAARWSKRDIWRSQFRRSRYPSCGVYGRPIWQLRSK